MSKKLKLLLPLLTLFATSACVGSTTAPPAVLSDYCVIAAPIGYDSERDTKETVAEIEKHNSQWACVCDHDCPKK